jgi:biopolymer transport protein ExbB/TolQ
METVGIILCLVTLYSIAMTAVVCFVMKTFRDTRRELARMTVEHQRSLDEIRDLIEGSNRQGRANGRLHEANQQLREERQRLLDVNYDQEMQLIAHKQLAAATSMRASRLQEGLAAWHAAGAACQ